MGAPSRLGFNLDQTFFGFRAEHQIQLHSNLFDLLWAGEGRWSYNDIYHLPLHLRKFWISKIKKIRADETEAMAKIKNKTNKIHKRPSKK